MRFLKIWIKGFGRHFSISSNVLFLFFSSFRVNVELQETHTSNKNVTRLENGEEKELISSHSGGYQPSTDEVSTDYGRIS